MILEKKVKKFLKPAVEMYRKLFSLHKQFDLKQLSRQDKVFILGVQKSGTTAIASLVSEATGQSVTLDVRRAIKRPGSRIMRNYGVEGFDDYIYRYRREFSRKIIKEPGLTFEYKQLKTYFPKAKFVMIVREPKDNIRSILNRLKLPGHIADLSPEEWPELRRSPAWRMNLDSSWLGYCSVNYVESLAYRWSIAADLYNSSPRSFIKLRYEDFLDSKKCVIEELAVNLGLHIVKNISGIVDNQHQSKGKRVSDYDEYFGDNLQYIYKHCSGLAKNLGYEV